MNKEQVRDILRKRGMNVRKKYGQNFLIDRNIVDKIMKVASVHQDDTVVEIGPGLGALTGELGIRAKEVIAYEIDAGLAGYLQEEFQSSNKVTIIQQDFLEVELNFPQTIKVISNLPYYITTPILFQLLESKQKIESIVVMMQKEVAERLVAKPRTKQYNALSVILQFLAEVKIEFHVPKTCFYPVPDVDSSIIHIKIKSPNEAIVTTDFITFVKNAFHQRRKTLLNNVASAYHLKKPFIEAMLEDTKHSPSIRAEELTLDQFIELYQYIKKAEM
jgi:16S rRNA (adenine1518-N6/adenine1519-N6)-dimethyltransferase